MLAAGLVSKTEGWPEQLARGLIVNLERNARASVLHWLSPANFGALREFPDSYTT
jgi:hypothetical protein